MQSKELIEQLQKQVLELQKNLLEQNALLANKDARIASLENSLEWFRKQIFGKKSEKHLPVNPDALQPTLFPELFSDKEIAAIEKATKQEEEQISKRISETKPNRKRVNSIDTSKLRVDEVIIEPSDINLNEYSKLGEEITEKLIYKPAEIYIQRTIRPKYVLKSSLQIKKPEQKAFVIAGSPSNPFQKSMASSSLMTEIILQKFQYHLPFYRVIQKFKEMNFVISDSTIGDWYSSTCVLLKPIYDLLKKQILESDYIQVDESTLPVIDNEKHRAVKGYVWVIRDAISGASYFHYTDGSRSHATAKALLGTYAGAIQTDGYNAYDQFENTKGKILLGCMAHCRRKFSDALKEDKKRASEAIAIIGKLYEIEKSAREKNISTTDLTVIRKEKSYPIIQVFEKWLIDNYSSVLKNSLIGNAISYTYTLLPRLSRYVLDGRYNVDNNLVENAIRPLAIGRKNYLFCGSPASATRAAMMYSFISSCKAANIDIREWFMFAIEKIADLTAENNLAALLPQNFISTKS